jgi:glycerol-1-phosphate dehydrogenase [NAD(P)+]
VSEFYVAISDDLSDLRAMLDAAPESSSLRPIGLREVVHGAGAVRELPNVLRRLNVATNSSLTVLTDATSKPYGSGDVMDVVLAVLGVDFQVVPEVIAPTTSEGIVLADEATVANAVRQVRLRAPDALVSVGSGTITDIAKVVASELSIPHVVVQTAASVNGFADDQSVLLVEGAKRTTPSRWPDALIIDPLVVASAPLEMTRSGLGDQLSMFSAAADWYLSSAVGFDTSYSPTVVSMMRRGIESLLSNSADLGRGVTSAVSALADCLMRGGVAMGVAGRTAPSSGLEHTISHLLEMHADAHAEPSASHGSQVGVSSVLAALAWRRVSARLARGDVALLEENVATRDRVMVAFADLDSSGTTARECWRLYERKASWIRDHVGDLQRIVDDWSAHADEIAQLLKPVDAIVAALRDAQAPVGFHQLHPPPPERVVVWAVTNCHLLRDRFGVIDLADLMGAWTLDDVAAVLGELAELAR